MTGAEVAERVTRHVGDRQDEACEFDLRSGSVTVVRRKGTRQYRAIDAIS